MIVLFIIYSTISLEIAFYFPECIPKISPITVVIIKDKFEKVEFENREERKETVAIDELTKFLKCTQVVEMKKGKKRKGEEKEKSQSE